MQRLQKFGLYIGTVGLIGFMGFSYCTFNVQQNEVALVFNKLQGIENRVLGQGLHFYNPALQTPIFMKNGFQRAVLKQLCKTKDKKDFEIQVEMNYKPMDGGYIEVYQNFGLNYSDILLPSLTAQSLQKIFGKLNKKELTNIEKYSKQLEGELNEEGKKFKIIIDDVIVKTI